MEKFLKQAIIIWSKILDLKKAAFNPSFFIKKKSFIFFKEFI